MSAIYIVKEIAGPTLQGEGPHAGWPATILRLAGCNAWDGRPRTRADSACPYCDTDFVGGEPLGLTEIRRRLTAVLPPRGGCVLTGGEPLLQADAELLAMLSATCAWVDLETNGTRHPPSRPAGLTVVCSPKRIPDQPVVIEPDAWKILIPDQAEFLDPALDDDRPVWVQPVHRPGDPEAGRAALAACLELCLTRGTRLSLQQHKLVGLE